MDAHLLMKTGAALSLAGDHRPFAISLDRLGVKTHRVAESSPLLKIDQE